jgi:hypothetical protein
MDGKVRRKVAMGTGARDFGRRHPVDSPEFILILGELDELLALVQVEATTQRDGFIDRHAASVRKRELRARIRATHLPHLAQAGESAAPDNHELAQSFVAKPDGDSYAVFQTRAGGMAAVAEEHKDLLVKRGMSLAVLEDLKRSLKDFDAAVELGNAGRAAGLQASAALRHLGDEIVRRVRLLDAINRLHFRDDPSVLAAWAAVSRVQAAPKSGAEPSGGGQPGQPSGTPPAGNDVRPAA